MAEYEGAEKHIDTYDKLMKNEKISEWDYAQTFLHSDNNIRRCLLKCIHDDGIDKRSYFECQDKCEWVYYSCLPSSMDDVVKVAKNRKLHEVYEDNIVKKQNMHKPKFL